MAIPEPVITHKCPFEGCGKVFDTPGKVKSHFRLKHDEKFIKSRKESWDRKKKATGETKKPVVEKPQAKPIVKPVVQDPKPKPEPAAGESHPAKGESFLAGTRFD
jgi:hypothetical protein